MLQSGLARHWLLPGAAADRRFRDQALVPTPCAPSTPGRTQPSRARVSIPIHGAPQAHAPCLYATPHDEQHSARSRTVTVLTAAQDALLGDGRRDIHAPVPP